MKKQQPGFAMLLVFLMAAMIAISLYMQVPRVAFETQRNKEQILIERGEQYKRAIQLFVRKNGKYPGEIKELENTNNIRYLRHRYKDPMTGKDEWRLIHVQNGVLTDSWNTKAKDDKNKKEENRNTFIGEGPVMGATNNPNASQGPLAVTRRRQSEMAGLQGGQPTGQPGDPNAALTPGAVPIPGLVTTPGQAGQPGQAGIPGQPQIPGMPGMPGTQQPGAVPGSGSIGTMPYLGQPANSQTGGTSPYPTMPGSQGNTPPGFLQPGTTPSQTQVGQRNPATDMIMRALTSSRGSAFASGSAGGTGQTIGGGIAGVATKMEADAIMVYDEHDKYQLWEFIYDPAKDRTGAGRANQYQGTRPDQMNSQGSGSGSGFGSGGSGFGSGSGSGFGSGSGSGPGSSSGFGQRRD